MAKQTTPSKAGTSKIVVKQPAKKRAVAEKSGKSAAQSVAPAPTARKSRAPAVPAAPVVSAVAGELTEAMRFEAMSASIEFVSEDMPAGYAADEVTGESDVLDTWATSSVSPAVRIHSSPSRSHWTAAPVMKILPSRQ